jgi:LmbE family N-acetylglucosaminyl deacetylase
MNILVIAPHPDDEVLGLGGTIAKYIRKGDRVFRCILTRAYPPQYSEEIIKIKREESEKAGEVLGIEKTYYLDFPTLRLDTFSLFEIQQKIMDCVNDCQPEIVYLPHRGDVNKDHRVAFEAGLLIAKFTKESKVKKVLSYEVICSASWAPPFPEMAFIPDVFEDISKTKDKKLEAFKCYKSEIKDNPHPRSMELVENSIKRWGGVIGVEAAEAFVLIRERIQ